MTRFVLRPARSAADIAATAALLRAYADALGIDLGFQGFESELADLPGKYAPPAGELLLACAADGAMLGCVALRPLEGNVVCEMKRLYVRPDGRRLGIGKALVAAIIAAAEARLYREMRLDTLPTMQAALALYRSFGFSETPGYCYNPIAGAVFLSKALTDARRRGQSATRA